MCCTLGKERNLACASAESCTAQLDMLCITHGAGGGTTKRLQGAFPHAVIYNAAACSHGLIVLL
jgi:hypothetical protein